MRCPSARSRAGWLAALAARLILVIWCAGAVGLPAVLAQPDSGDFFPLGPSAATFDPAAALSATGEAAADRDAPDAAFAGLADRVQVDQLLGQATTRVSVEVPPGRRGMTPQLALTYGSRGGNGLVGRGWDLRTPCVKRSTRFGVPIDWSNGMLPYADDEFVLVMPNGTVVLDRVLGTSGANTVYGSTAEEAMLRVWFNSVANTWTVTDKSGVQYQFGVGAASNASRAGINVAQASYTFSWGLTKITDPSGNSITYSYAPFAVDGTSNGALYPARIDYGANTNASYADIFHVCFAYDPGGANCSGTPAERPDPIVSHAGGYPAETRYRLTGIKVWSDADPAARTPAVPESTEAIPTRRYALSYVQDPLSGESRLNRIDLYAGAETLRPTTFSYNASAQMLSSTASLQFFAAGSPRTQLSLRRNTIYAGTRSDLVDMTGDGRPDWVECNGESIDGTWFVHPNLGNGQFGPRQTWTGPQCGMHGYHYELMDMNGDSLPDFVFTVIPNPGGNTRNWDIWYNTGSGFSAKYTWSVPPPPANTVNYGIWPNPLNGSGGTRDLNGDGLPDAIDTYCNCNENGIPSYCSGQEGLCRIYLGAAGGFESPGVLWSWPRIYGLPGLSNQFETHLGRTLYSLQDLTGDGLPDLLMSRPPLDSRVNPQPSGECFGGNNGQVCTSDAACGLGTCIDPTAWGVFVNTGAGFAFDSVCSGGSRDGLDCGGGCPGGRCEDLPQYWNAPVDAGAEPMDIEQACGHSNTPLAGWPPIGLEGALRDMNGDGLPDYVDANVNCDAPQQGPGWRVFINTGTDFSSTPVAWSGTAGLLVQKWVAQDDIVAPPADVSVVAADTLDFDGDAIPDYVEAPTFPLTRIDVRRGQGPPPGTLSKQENGLGGGVEVSYALAAAIEPLPSSAAKMCSGGASDGQPCRNAADCSGGTCAPCSDCDHAPFALTAVSGLTITSGLSGPGHTLTKTYRYLAPYYDWQQRELRGFRWAVEEDAARGRRVETEFWQPGATPRSPSTACGAPTQVCIDLIFARPFKGKPRRTRLRELGNPRVHRETTSTWEPATVADPRLSGQQSLAVRLSASSEQTWGSAGTTSLVSRRELDHDAYNNVTEERRYNGATLASKTTTGFQYNAPSWIVDRPTSIEVRDSASQLLSRRTFSYTGSGNLSVASRYLDNDPIGPDGVTIAVSTLGYTGVAGLAGQPTSITDARNNTTTLVYQESGCDTVGLYPCAISNPLGHTTHRMYALELGAVTEERDANDLRTRMEYDDFGRLAKFVRGTASGALPQNLLAWRELSYFLGSPGGAAGSAMPTRIQTRVREPGHAAGFRIENRFHDGLGRFLETKTEGIVDGVARVVRREAVRFDAAGRGVDAYVPTQAAQALDAYEAPSGSSTVTAFDLLDRPTQVTRPDGNARTTLYDPAGIADQRDENYIACNGQPGQVANASCPGKRSVEQRDALGRLIDVKVYAGTTLDTQTINEYDGLDRMTSTKLAADEDSKVTFGYDSFDRRIQLIERNSGTWVYGYDAAGNLIFQNDPNGNQHLEWCFDQLNRPAAKRAFTSDAFSDNSCGSAGELRTSYSYDDCTNGVGRLCQQDSPGRHALTRHYSARGQVVSETRAITAAGQTRTVTYGFTYDEADRLKTATYPTESDGLNELLTNNFDAAGQLASVSTPYNIYLSNAVYDVFGRSLALDLASGAGAVREQRGYFDATGNFRLKQLAVTRGTTALQTWNYGPSSGGAVAPGYDRAGNLLRIDDVTPTGQYGDNSERDNDWTYTYDGLGRLTGAAWEAKPTAAAFAYADGLGNMTAGNLAFPDLTAGTAVTFNRDATRPHHISWSQPPGSGSAYQYESSGAGGDGNGGMASRPATIAGDTAKSILYDVEGRVRRVTAGSNIVDSVYDDEGMRVARIVNGTDITFFFGRFAEVRGGTLTRHVFAGERRIAFSPVGAPPSLTLAALADGGAAVRLARAASDARWLRSLPPLGPDLGAVAAAAGGAVLVLGTLVLLLVPSDRRRLGLLTMRRGHVAALVVFYVFALPAWPVRRPPSAGPGGALAGCDPPAPKPAYLVLVDHLGSTTLLTRYSDGTVMQYLRYGPYGAPQAFDANGARVANGSELTELTYTGQRWDAFARLYYYVARYYDPLIGSFVNADPARQFFSPYVYGGWTPTRFVDPSGMTIVGVALGLNNPDLALWYERVGMVPRGGTSHTVASMDNLGNIGFHQEQGGASSSIAGLVAALGIAQDAVAAEAHQQGAGAGQTPAAIGPPQSFNPEQGYVDFNTTISVLPLWGVLFHGPTFGYQVSYGQTGDQALYVGWSITILPSLSSTLTAAPGQVINEGANGAATFTSPTRGSIQGGVGFGSSTGLFGEAGPGFNYGPNAGFYPTGSVSITISIGTGTMSLIQALGMVGDPSTINPTR